ncbi:hypothetical protein MK541_09605 [Streptococcus gallolyticus subsp. gallolyticus]|uniref:hypothetical protein n=1 Tax=Streptococcus gallolyticus TaxID=315405 RepID=UPI002283F570|nr:hypothetical protein [Streptococcus gallolyticus]MCY7152426.1 hypothetical protein [Streptococcus gallolyticus subsp. gallolyticus]
MLQIVKNFVKEEKLDEYIRIAQEFTNDLNQLENVIYSKVYVENNFVYIVTNWNRYDSDIEFEVFMKYKSEMKPLFIANESFLLKEIY